MEPPNGRRRSEPRSPPAGALTSAAPVIKPPGGEHVGDVIARPKLEPVENRRESSPEWRDCIFDRDRRRRQHGSGDQPVAIHLLQGLRKHLLRHAFNIAPESVEAAWFVANETEGQHHPLVADPIEQQPRRAAWRRVPAGKPGFAKVLSLQGRRLPSCIASILGIFLILYRRQS